VTGSALAAATATAEAAGGSTAATTAAAVTGAGAASAAFLATFSFLAGAATGAGAGAGATTAVVGAGAGADSFLVATFFTTDLFAELIVLLPVEVFIVFKRTNYYNKIFRHQIFVKLWISEHVNSGNSPFFYLNMPELSHNYY
jgi:hypothetical protein